MQRVIVVFFFCHTHLLFDGFCGFQNKLFANFVEGLNAYFNGFIFMFDYQLGATLWLCSTDLH